MRKYAAYRAIDQYADSTRKDLESYARAYERHAEAAGHDPMQPSQAWFDGLILGVAKRAGAKQARKLLRGAWYFFASRKLKFPLSLDEANAALFKIDHPVGQRAHGLRRPRAQRYADNEIAPDTLAEHKRYEGYWLEFMIPVDLDPYQPTTDATVQWMDHLRNFLEPTSIRVGLNALSRFCERLGVPDVTRSAKVERELEGMLRDRVREPRTHYDLAKIRQLMSSFGDAPLEIRDGFVLLLVYFGGLNYREIVETDRANVFIDGDYLVFEPGPNGSPAFRIGGCDDPLLDLRRWAKRWLAITGTSSGPLIPGIGNRRSSRKALSPEVLQYCIKRAAEKAGLDTTQFSHAMRLSFRADSLHQVGIVQTAHHARRKVKTISDEFPTPSGRAELAKRRQRFGKKRARFELPADANKAVTAALQRPTLPRKVSND